MRALTVRQPWAWAIIHGGKDVENRVRQIAGTYRGPVAIHAGLRWSDEGARSPLVAEAYFDARLKQGWRVANRQEAVRNATRRGLGRFLVDDQFGAFIGVVDLINEHPSPAGSLCCGPWAVDGAVHLALRNPRPLARPIPCRGRLGLWAPPAEAHAALTGEATP